MRSHSLMVKVLKAAALVVSLAVACKVSKGYAAVLIVLAGVVWAMQNRSGRSLCCFVVMPFIVIMNPNLIGITKALAFSSRVGILLIGLAMALSATRRIGRFGLPLHGMFFYLCVEVVSSFNGYCPSVSFLKLINFSLFMLGITVGTRNLDRCVSEVANVRLFLLGMCAVMLVGSLALLPFPAYAYLTSAQVMLQQYGAEVANQMMREVGTEGALFAGLTNHSQALAPISALMMTFVLADMFFVEQRVTLVHGGLVLCAFVCCFLTRSRTGLLSMTTGFLMVCLFASPRVWLSPSMKQRVKRMVLVFSLLVVVVAAVGEVRNNAVTKWLRKNDTAESGSTLGEALTSTRMGAVNELWADFQSSPLFGTGFQVNAESARFKGAGFVLFAPVEKGLLPMVVLGEGGILGVFAFSCFLLFFYAGCLRQNLYVTCSMFTTYLVTNIGEATFFSPGGAGGIMWIFATVGGVTLDAYLRGTRMRNALMEFSLRRGLVPGHLFG